ncbi:helix-turn-helix domain-containing protein [Nonomuraea sp. NPDC050394]|uniref:helix-turn-helix domain-containing protein n=1 Tax=Nonomuraea sp. NPDC050394 TaxID=3364363 RepID=UPI00379D1EF1
MRDTWTIGELAERAADALRPGLQRANGRIREVPGERLIRWYTTIGLVDPPLTRRGRLAQYGRRHLLQVVAVKRLQAEGHSIAEIQTRLTGATDAMLEATAHLDLPGGDLGDGLGGDLGGDLGEGLGGELPDGTRDEAPRPRFWASHPTTEPTPSRPTTQAGPGGPPRAEPFARSADGASAGAGQPEAAVASSQGPSSPGSASGCSAPEAARGLAGDATQETARKAPREAAREAVSAAVQKVTRQPDRGGGRVSGVWLAPGVALVLDGAGRTPTDDDIEAVLAAAGPLLQVLQERKLT